jgi:Protein of unknown function (DUF3326)
MRLCTRIEKLAIDTSGDPVTTALGRAADLTTGGTAILRWGLLARMGDQIAVEYALLEGARSPSALSGAAAAASPRAGAGVATAIVVPTGVGARIGGFIADAGPLARTIEALSDVTILHPNVVNGGDFYGAGDGAHYVDGLTLDRFFAGEARLSRRTRPRRIGLLVERMAQAELDIILNAANAVRAIHGVDLVAYAVTDEEIAARVTRSSYGHFVGTVGNPEVLLAATERLVAAGADAIAAVTTCGGTTAGDWTSHYLEAGPNPVGALEALISRFITWSTGLPCAHAPAYVGDIGSCSGVVDPRAAGEVASGTGLPCILLGLARAPDSVARGGVGVDDLTAIVVPFGCAGGAPALAARRFGVPMLAIRANPCVVGVPADQLDIAHVALDGPADAVAWLACARANVAWDVLRAPPRPVAEAPGAAIRRAAPTRTAQLPAVHELAAAAPVIVPS